MPNICRANTRNLNRFQATYTVAMQLNAFVSATRSELHADLCARRAPRVGSFDGELLKDLFSGKDPQLGSVRYTPHAVHFEFIYPQNGTAATVFTVDVTPPERIVFLPVPNWVVENIWEGEVTGSYVLESEVEGRLAEFRAVLDEESNQAYFGRQEPTRRQ